MNTQNSLNSLQTPTDAFFTVDGEWRFLFVNDVAERGWQREPGSLIGKVMWDEFPRLIDGPFAPAYWRAATERQAVSIASQAPLNGRWYELRVYPMREGLAANFRDITDARNTESDLARLATESERERRVYQTVLSNTADFNYVFDLNGRFTFVNTALLQLWQKTFAETVGKTFSELDYPSDLADRLQDQIRHVIETGQTVRDETPYTSAFGTRAYEYILVPVFDASGSVEAVAGSTRDITERKESEVALRDEARRKDEFLATLAHELRNPLAPIRNALEVSRLSKGNHEALEQAHDIMERQLGNMVRLIDDLLDLSRISLGKVELRCDAVDLAMVVQSAVETARPHIEQAGHDLRLNIPADVLSVSADATRLAQVFSNLLTNAAKFTPRNGKIVLTVKRDGRDAVVSVKDNGVGIDHAMLLPVFDMFTQAPDNMERAQGGLGIGLTLVKGLTQLHGGSVVAHSDGPGTGAEFVVRLPMQFHGVAPGDLVPDFAVTASTAAQHILIVDDNADSAQSLAMMLSMLGHETRTANDGFEALELAELFMPDVCLLDIGMPNLNGYELARRMRQQPWGEDILLVALTGWGQDEDKRRSAEAGINMHLVKPVSPAALMELLERHASGLQQL